MLAIISFDVIKYSKLKTKPYYFEMLQLPIERNVLWNQTEV